MTPNDPKNKFCPKLVQRIKSDGLANSKQVQQEKISIDLIGTVNGLRHSLDIVLAHGSI